MFPGPKNRKRAVAVVDNDRKLSLTGGGGKEAKEGGKKEGKGRAQKVTVLFTLRERERREGER